MVEFKPALEGTLASSLPGEGVLASGEQIEGGVRGALLDAWALQNYGVGIREVIEAASAEQGAKADAALPRGVVPMEGAQLALTEDKVEVLRTRTPLGEGYLKKDGLRPFCGVGVGQGQRRVEITFKLDVDGLAIIDGIYNGPVRLPDTTAQATNFKNSAGTSVTFAEAATVSSDNAYIPSTRVNWSFEIPFTGTALEFRSFQGTTGGRWQVVVDGVITVFLSTWAPASVNDVRQLVVSGLPNVPHVAKFTFVGDDPAHVPSGGAGTGRGWFNYEDGTGPIRPTANVYNGSELSMDWTQKGPQLSIKVLEAALKATPQGSGFPEDWWPAHGSASGASYDIVRRIWVNGALAPQDLLGFPTTDLPLREFVMEQTLTAYNPNSGKTQPMWQGVMVHRYVDGVMNISHHMTFLRDVVVSTPYIAQLSALYDFFPLLEANNGFTATMTAGSGNYEPGVCTSIVWKGTPGLAVAMTVVNLNDSINFGKDWGALVPTVTSDRSGGAGTYNKLYVNTARPGVIPSGAVVRSHHKIFLSTTAG